MNTRTDTAYTCSIVLFLLCICLAAGTFAYAKLHTQAAVMRATGLRWQYWINVERFSSIAMDTARYTMPGDAYNVNIYTLCTGSGKKRSCENRATYLVDRWVYDHTLVNEGKPGQEMVYPAFQASVEQKLGAVRESDRGKTYLVDFSNGYAYAARDYYEWIAFIVEASYTVEVNHFNEPQWATLRKE